MMTEDTRIYEDQLTGLDNLHAFKECAHGK